jgi:hypothetical protein
VDGREFHPPQSMTVVALVAGLVMLGLSWSPGTVDPDWMNSHATVRYVMADILDLLANEPPTALRELCVTQDLKGLIEKRCAGVPEPVRSCFLAEAGAYLGQLRFTMRYGLGSDHPLVLTLAWDDARGRWFRIERICPAAARPVERSKGRRRHRANSLTYRCEILHSLRRPDRRKTA